MSRLLVQLALFLSGFAALVYQVCWIRQASLVFASTTQALSTVRAAWDSWKLPASLAAVGLWWALAFLPAVRIPADFLRGSGQLVDFREGVAAHVAVVGIGTGQTSSRFLDHAVELLECVDIEPAIFEVLRDHFDASWMNAPRVRLIQPDGRNHIRLTDQRYDLSSLELGQLS